MFASQLAYRAIPQVSHLFPQNSDLLERHRVEAFTSGANSPATIMGLSYSARFFLNSIPLRWSKQLIREIAASASSSSMSSMVDCLRVPSSARLCGTVPSESFCTCRSSEVQSGSPGCRHCSSRTDSIPAPESEDPQTPFNPGTAGEWMNCAREQRRFTPISGQKANQLRIRLGNFFKTESDIPGANLYLTKSWDADRWILAREFQIKVTRLAPDVSQIAANRIPQDRQCLARNQERVLSLQSRHPHDCLPMRAAPAFGTG